MPASVAAALAAVGDDAPPLLRLAAVMPSLAAWDRRQPPRTRIDRAKLIVSQLPLALAHPPANEALAKEARSAGMAARLLGWAPDSTASESEIAALDRVLVACAEHELNASTFAAQPRLLSHRLRAHARFPALDSGGDFRDWTIFRLDSACAGAICRQPFDSPADAVSRRSAAPFRIAFHKVFNGCFDAERVEVV